MSDLRSEAEGALDRDEVLGLVRARIVGYAAYLQGRDMAEDLAQDVLIVLETKYKSVDRLEDLVPLSIRILRFKVWALRRKERRRKTSSEVSLDDLDIDDPRVDIERERGLRDLVDRLSKAIKKLRPEWQKLISLRLDGLTTRQIQGRLGVEAENTIYTWERRTRKELREALGPDALGGF